MVIVLLLLGMFGAFAALWAAQSDGGVEVIDGYYEKAVNWDERAALEQGSTALGWHLSAEVDPPEVAGLRHVRLSVVDRSGAPVTGLRGTMVVERPQLVATVAEVPLNEDPQRPGTYRQSAPIAAAGLWDFEIRATRDTAVFIERVRRDLP